MFFIDRGVDPDRRNFGIGKCEKRMLGRDGDEERRVCVYGVLVPAILSLEVLSLLAKYTFYLNLFFFPLGTSSH